MILSNQMLSIFAAHLSLKVRKNPISKIADLLYIYHTWDTRSEPPVRASGRSPGLAGQDPQGDSKSVEHRK